LPMPTLRSWFPWIVAFSIANGFMEELWCRGLWLAAFKQALGPSAAMHVTSVAFCEMHVIVYWREPTAILMLTPAWLYMGYAYAVIVRKTGSLWGAVLAHAIADVLYLYINSPTGRGSAHGKGLVLHNMGVVGLESHMTMPTKTPGITVEIWHRSPFRECHIESVQSKAKGR